MNATNRLKTDTLTLHQHAESSEIITRILGRKITKEEYVAYLHGYSILYAIFETQIQKCSDPLVRSFWRAEYARASLIYDDIRQLDNFLPPINESFNQTVVKKTEIIRMRALARPLYLIGYLYVLEGSTNGNQRLHSCVTRCLNLGENQAIAFLTSGASNQAKRWDAFKRKLDQFVADEKTYAEVLAGACEMFELVTSLLEAIVSISGKKAYVVSSVNPEAGEHAMPQNESEIRIVEQVGRKCRNKFPYIDVRYCDRGSKFTLSDGMWLVSLIQMPEKVASKQVFWLASLLANLGLPPIVLEYHLRQLHKELTKSAVKKDHYSLLLQLANEFGTKRIAFCSDQYLNKCEEKATSSFGTEFRGYSSIVISEELERLSGNVPENSVLEWLANGNTIPDDLRVYLYSLVNEIRGRFTVADQKELRG